jgi:hypothetical protein
MVDRVILSREKGLFIVQLTADSEHSESAGLADVRSS